MRVRAVASILGHPAGTEFDVDPDDRHAMTLLDRGWLERVGVEPAAWCLLHDIPVHFSTPTEYAQHLADDHQPNEHGSGIRLTPPFTDRGWNGPTEGLPE